MQSECGARALALLGIILNSFTLVAYAVSVCFLAYSMLGYTWSFYWNWSYYVAQVMMLLLGFVFGVVLPTVAYPRMAFKTKTTAALLLVVGGAVSMLSLGGLLTGIGGLLQIIAGVMTSALQPPRVVPYEPLAWETTTEPPPVEPDVSASGGFVTPPGARYCVACGAQLEGNESRCPVCSTPIG